MSLDHRLLLYIITNVHSLSSFFLLPLPPFLFSLFLLRYIIVVYLRLCKLLSSKTRKIDTEKIADGDNKKITFNGGKD